VVTDECMAEVADRTSGGATSRNVGGHIHRGDTRQRGQDP
jgi:hypothetical protein